MSRPLFIALLLVSGVAAANDPANDAAIAEVLRRAQPYVRHVEVSRRQQVSDTLDIVVAVGSERDPAGAQGQMLGPGVQPVGLFLQERGGRFRVFTLTVTRLRCDIFFVLHVSSSDVIFACENEKNDHYREKFVYDVNAKALVKAFRYQPFAVTSARVDAGRVVVSATNEVRRVIADYDAVRQPPWRVRQTLAGGQPGGGRCLIGPLAPSATFGPSKSFQLVPWVRADNQEWEWLVRERRAAISRHHRLPQSTYAEYATARGHEHRDLRRGDVEIDEGIGPVVISGDELWVGKTFYNGEGMTGIGGIATFDTSSKRFEVFTGPLLAGWSVSAIHADEQSVWVSRVRYGELHTENGGLVRFDRATRRFHLVDPDGGIGCRFVSAGDRLLLGTDAGVTIVHGEQVSHVMFDQTSDGRVRVVASER